MASRISEIVPKFTAETLRSAAKQSEGCHTVPVRLRRAIKRYLREQEETNMRRKVLSLSQSFSNIKDVNLQLTSSSPGGLIDDPLGIESSQRWKIKSAYGDIGFKYSEAHTVAYVASRMPAVYSACYRILSEVRRRLPGFSPTRVLDFGAGTGSAMWALREVWPSSLERINIVEPSQSMQRAGQSLIKNLKDLPHIQSFDSILSLNKKIKKGDREHDLVIASYVLGEIPSVQDRIAIVRQLWNLTRDVLVLVEPGTPQGSNIISQMRSHILWMENRKFRKAKDTLNESSKDLVPLKHGAFVVAPCPHDGKCPLDNTGKYCHFVQRLERTTSQRAYKRSKGEPLRGFEDEKFSFVVFKRGQRVSEPWPLDGIKFDTLKEKQAKRNPLDLVVDYEDQFETEVEDIPEPGTETEDVPDGGGIVSYDSDVIESDTVSESDEDGEDEERGGGADVGSGWGRIVYSPVRRGRLVEMNVCRATKRDGSEGSFDRVVMTKSKNPILHRQAKKSLWGDLWPL